MLTPEQWHDTLELMDKLKKRLVTISADISKDRDLYVSLWYLEGTAVPSFRHIGKDFALMGLDFSPIDSLINECYRLIWIIKEKT